MSMMRELMGGMQNGGAGLPSPFGAFANLISKFNRFRQNPMGELMGMGVQFPQNVQGNPEAMVNYLRSSGQMTNEQFNQFSNLANQFSSFMGSNNR